MKTLIGARKILAICLTVLMMVVVAGCGGGPKKVTDQKVTLNLVYGDRDGFYTGEVNEQNIPNGKGKFVNGKEDNKWVYEGDFKNGHFEGNGKTTWPNGQEEIGTYSNDMLNGQGKKTLVALNGQKDTYEGNFVAGSPVKEGTAAWNEDVSFADWKYRVTGVTTQSSAGNRQAGGQYVVVTLDETNNANAQRQPGADNFFVLFDKTNGKVYNMDLEAPLQIRLANKTFNTPWIWEQVNPGITAQGIIFVFDVPKDIDLGNLWLLPRLSKGDVLPIPMKQ